MQPRDQRLEEIQPVAEQAMLPTDVTASYREEEPMDGIATGQAVSPLVEQMAHNIDNEDDTQVDENGLISTADQRNTRRFLEVKPEQLRRLRERIEKDEKHCEATGQLPRYVRYIPCKSGRQTPRTSPSPPPMQKTSSPLPYRRSALNKGQKPKSPSPGPHRKTSASPSAIPRRGSNPSASSSVLPRRSSGNKPTSRSSSNEKSGGSQKPKSGGSQKPGRSNSQTPRSQKKKDK